MPTTRTGRRPLERRIFTARHLRLRKSRNEVGVMALARKGQTVERPRDLIKSPLILDLPKPAICSVFGGQA